METTEIIIRDDGTLVERTLRERELDAGPAVLEALTQGVSRDIRNVMSIPDWGLVHASAGFNHTLWSVAIDRIPLHARFRLVKGVLVPAFASASDLEMPLVWHAPPEVRLAFVIQTQEHEDGVRLDGNWLFAFSQSNRGYRLPLPNLHDDCRICTGSFPDHYPTGTEAVLASLEQFRKSKWNADLMRTAEQSQRFFRFQATNETFATLPIEAEDWTSLCEKVSTDLMEEVVL